MKRLLVFPLLFVLLFSSCTNYRDIEIKSVKLYDVKLVSTSRAMVEVEYVIDNTANADIVLASADGFLTKDRVNFAQITLIKADTIAMVSETKNRALFQVEILDPISLFSMGLNIKNWKMSDFEINARGLIHNSKGGRKVIKFKNMPLENLIKRF
ncbi:MAG: hypothetical protein ACD_77C00322G0013 [uncultured bacterium]|nr:MAG: hypothetical protein ACD_77C00322G0013 [uncultured bacterium]HBY02113.1 hypothetical protein [Rikenellaceae bacterium]